MNKQPTPVHGASALGGRDLLQVRNSVQEADAAVDQHALEAKAKPVQARQPLQGVAGRQAPPRRAAGAAADGGQYERVSQSRELLYSVPAALCEEIVRACGAAEHSGPGFLQWKMPSFSMFFCMFFFGGATKLQK